MMRFIPQGASSVTFGATFPSGKVKGRRFAERQKEAESLTQPLFAFRLFLLNLYGFIFRDDPLAPSGRALIGFVITAAAQDRSVA